MTFGQPVTIPTLLDALEGQISKDTGLGRTYVFTSLADDSDLLESPPGDRFVAIRPGKFPVDQGTAASGGRNLTGFNSTWRIAVFARIKSDQEFRSGQILRSVNGPLALVWTIMKGSLVENQQGGQMFTPLDGDGACVLREPGRLLQFDLDAKKVIGEQGQSTWSVIPTYWEFKFTADLVH